MKPTIKIYKDPDALAHAAARRFIQSVARAVMDRGRFLVALSGGNTPLGLYHLLALPPYREQVEWPQVHVFWADERCVPSGDPQSNYGQAREVILSRVPIPEENIHRIRSEVEPAAAAKDYANVLNDFADPPLHWPRFDLVLLGMGDDGHTASLFPGPPVEASTPTLAITARYQDRPADRVTLTPLVFNSARRVVFLVSGQSKSETLARVLYGEYHPENLAVQRIRPADGKVIWLVDQAAASKIQN